MEEINVVVSGSTFKTERNVTFADFFKSNSKLKEPLVCSVNDKFYDLNERIVDDCEIEPIYFESDKGKEVFWHSSAHILGYAIMQTFPSAKLSSGPPVENGFYYDVWLENPITQNDYEKIEKNVNEIIKNGYSFIKEYKMKSELIDLYRNNEFKSHYVSKVEDGSTVYIIDKFIDFCLGPHIKSTKLVKSFSITKHSSTYFLGKSDNKSLQRIYGISFPEKKMMTLYKKNIEKAKEMDHRRIGIEKDLFFFDELSPGSCFFLPKGAHIYNKLIQFLKFEYKKRGFQEVITPNIFHTKLWEQSGHLKNYAENMFSFNIEEQQFALKPMNCPGHCIMFKHRHHSYKELPLRYADFGVLHRNEFSGALTGLTRVRRFQQDDAHIFCTNEQVEEEIAGCLDFIDYVYSIFKFSYEIKLSTRPEKFIGDEETWNNAETKLKEALNKFGKKYVINHGDGAFYGPKIDIVLKDALGRKAQCATIQLDFQLPQRFNLGYIDSNGDKKMPIMIHRAIMGSVERMIAIIIENFGMKVPFWLSPYQVAIVCISEDQNEYAKKVKSFLFDFEVDIYNDKNEQLNKKILRVEKNGYKIILVIGRKEQDSNEVNLRGHGNIKLEVIKNILSKMTQEFKELPQVLIKI